MSNWELLRSFASDKKQQIVLASIILILIAINVPRLTHNLFWADECFSIYSVQSFSILIDNALWDAGSHPPLYLFMLFFHCLIFGHSPVSYQLYPMIAWILIMIVGATFVRKRFGFASATIFILLSAFLRSSVEYITEVRSYEWDALFILLSYIFLLKILNNHQNKDYCLFTLFSILSAYSHYYCALAVAFFYLTLLIDSIAHHRDEIKRTLIITAITVVAYIPWMIIAFKSIMRVSGNFWATYIPPLDVCLTWMFESDHGLVLTLIMMAFTVFIVVNNARKNENKLSGMDVWLLAGILSIFGSIIVSTIVSNIRSPILVLRYIYPISIVAWLLFSYSIINSWQTNKGMRKTVSIIAISLILIAGVPFYHTYYDNEVLREQATENTLNDLSELTQCDNAVVMSDIVHIASDIGIIGYYFPGVGSTYFGINKLQDLRSDTQYYLFISNPIDSVTINALNVNGYTYETMSENAQLDIYRFYAYKIVPL